MLNVVTLLRVDWEAESKLAQAQQRTIESLEEAIATGANPVEVLAQEARDQAAEEGASLVWDNGTWPNTQFSTLFNV